MSNFKQFLEVSHEAIEAISARLENLEPNKLPFNNLFGDKYRIVFPLGDKHFKALKDALIGYFKQTKGNTVQVQFNWADKTIKVVYPRPAEKKKNPTAKRVPQKEIDPDDIRAKDTATFPELNSQTYSIGKAIQKAKLGKEIADWWSVVGNNEMVKANDRQELAEQGDKYSIIISRHPIDVLRMSDFDDISSCHGEGRDYWKCTKQEAVDGGPIAYLVPNDEIDGLEPEDFQDNELFDDQDRRRGSGALPAITPISRLRMRRFSSDFPDSASNKEFDFAVPETRVYGTRHPVLITKVMKWLQEKQQSLIERNGGRKKFTIENFKLRGGSYRDTSDAKLFNTYFGDSKDKGNTTHSYEGHEMMADQAEQYRTELQEIHDKWNGVRAHGQQTRVGKFKHCWSSYYENDDIEEFDYSVDGGVTLEVPIKLKYVPRVEDISRYVRKDDERGQPLTHFLGNYNYWLFHNDYDSVNDISYENKLLTLELRFNSEHFADEEDREFGLHPDAYEHWNEEIEREIDKNYDEIVELIKVWLHQEGFVSDENPAQDLLKRIQGGKIKFNNFDLVLPGETKSKDEAGWLFSLEAKAIVPVEDILFYYGGRRQYSERLIKKMIMKLFTNLMKTKHTMVQQQLQLPFTRQQQLPFQTDTEGEKWSKLTEPYESPYQMHQKGVPYITLGKDNVKSMNVKVQYDFQVNDDEETTNAALQNILVYDRNWRDLEAEAKFIVDRRTHVIAYGRTNYDQNKQAQLLGGKISFRKPEPATTQEVDPDTGLPLTRTSRGQLPLNPRQDRGYPAWRGPKL